jgi:two-component system, cell cycle sensor histidine kinase and response regulator CckA
MRSADSERLHVLLVDDDEDDYALTTDLVSQIRLPRRAELRWANTYEAGLEAVLQAKSDVCLLDYRLGARDGIELLAEVRSRGCHSPIIVLTGKSAVDTDTLAMQRGADDFLVKSDLTVALLERSIRYALERARQVEALRASEEGYRNIFENASDGILIVDLEAHVIRDANPRAARMLGYGSSAEMRGLATAAIHPKGSFRQVLADLDTLSPSAQAVAEIPCLRKDGTVFFADIAPAKIMMNGRAMGVGLLRDVTERKEGERALRASEARYRRLFEAAKDGILILDAATGRIVDVNPFMTELTGYARADFLTKSLWEIGPFRDTLASKVSFAELQSQEFVRYEDLPLATRTGGIVDVEFVSNVYSVGDHKVIQCNVRDNTARKRAEVDRTRLATAIEQADEAVVITDAEGAIEYVNPAFEIGSGYTRAEVMGRNPSILKSGELDAAFYHTLWATIRGGGTWRGRLINKKKDGTLYYEDATISPVRNGAGAVTSYVAVKRDVTASLALEAQFLQAQKMEAVGRLAGGVAHDFNNVLSVVLSYAELIAGDLPPESPHRADLEEIRRAGLRAAGLTRQLLAFSRRQVLEVKVVDLNEHLRGVKNMLAQLLGADVTLTILPAPNLWNVKVDPGQVVQILMNLAVNARDAMPLGGKLTIETANVVLDEAYGAAHEGVRPGEYVQIAVSDTGSGMDSATRARVFEPFFTTKEIGKGTGLGLATVFGIVEQSGGHVCLYSDPGAGTTFKVYFPRFIGAVVQPVPAGIEPDPARGTETILIVEDEDQVRVLAQNILRRSGYVVLEASNGGEALLICEQHGTKIHLLLTDVVLPRMSGRLLAERLAIMRPEMKILFMSGYTDDAVLLRGILESGFEFLQKPLTPTALTQKVREALDGRPKARASLR